MLMTFKSVLSVRKQSRSRLADITQFRSERLKLELSAEKTLITNAHDKAKFWALKFMSVSMRTVSETVMESRNAVIRR